MGTRLDPESLRVAVALRLGAPIHTKYKCIGNRVEADQCGLHGLHCGSTNGWHARHSEVNDFINRNLVSAQCPAERDPRILWDQNPDDPALHPDGITIYPLKRGRTTGVGLHVAIAQGMSDTLVAIFPKLSLPVATGECYPRVTHSESFAKLYMKLFAKSADNRALDDTQLYPYPLQQSVYVKDFPCPSHILITMRDHFRQEFTFNQRVLRKAKVQVAAALQALNTALRDATIVTVHVRRTDYLAHVKNYYKQSPVKDVYYQRAFNFFRNRTHNPVFVVTSDDPEWCKNNFKDKDIVYAGEYCSGVINTAYNDVQNAGDIQ
ncbi:galactoside alpha-(1,2)-fucosyltransferase 1-like [Procambarus clarkii]|uniref:galactoside alpha-(1,2)-fucosyltransferase 1-like n=1 Tax=Procambarus clarkii TaxID=6728 RepID=UPI00374221A5